MKKLIFVISIMLIISCKEKEMTDSEMNAILDSLELEGKKSNSLQYSIQDENKVIDSIRFGDSPKEFKQKMERFIIASKRKKSSILIDNEPYIGNYKFSECCYVDLYDENKLYYLRLGGYPISWRDYDLEIKEQSNYLKEIIAQQYGDPTETFVLPERINIEKGYTYTLLRWSIRNKRIDIRISTDRNLYFVDLYIYKIDVYEKMEAKDKLEAENKLKINEAEKEFKNPF